MSGGGALLAISPLSGALTQLETAERELAAQHADAVTRVDQVAAQLATAREIIGVLRRVGGSLPAPVRRDAPRAAAPIAGVLKSGKHGQAAAAGREHAVLLLIAGGTSATSAIREAISPPLDATAQQHRQSIQNALSRMKGKGLVVSAGDGWALTAKGRKAAGAAAKEAP